MSEPVIKTTLRPSGVLSVQLNRPGNLNAISDTVTTTLATILREAAVDDNVKAVVISATGRFFSSGLDLAGDEANKGLPVRKNRHFIAELIDFPKLVAAAVNGPAYGLGATLLFHCDLVWAAPSASLKTPFTSLGICAEGSSSYTFPRALPPSLTARLLYLSEMVTAPELVQCGFYTGLIQADSLQDTVLQKIDDAVNTLSIESIKTTKGLVKDLNERARIHSAGPIEGMGVSRLMESDFFKASLKAFADKAAAKAKASQAKL